MKKIPVFIFLVLLGMANTGISWSQDKALTDTALFKVSGVCDQCKARIENAALIKGVRWAQWDKETQILTVIYRSDRVNPDAVHASVAHAGHDTDKVKASEEAYNRLPRCCAYRDDTGLH